jgi:hypothetical protein
MYEFGPLASSQAKGFLYLYVLCYLPALGYHNSPLLLYFIFSKYLNIF